MFRTILLILVLYTCAPSQTIINGSRAITGEWDARNAERTMPNRVGDVLPETCANGETFHLTTAPDGQKLRVCAAGKWEEPNAPQPAPEPLPNLRFTFANQRTVTMQHNRNTLAVVIACYSEQGRMVEPSHIVILDANTVEVGFGITQSGACVLNSASSGFTVATTVTPSSPDLKVGNGLTMADGLLEVSPSVPAYATYVASLAGWKTIAAHACMERNFPATGIMDGDRLATGFPSKLPPGLAGMMYATPIELIVVRLCNVTPTSVAVPDGLTFGAAVVRSF